MDFLSILVSAILGTTVMTAFSYSLSRVTRKQFREPELLNELMVRLRLLKFITSKNHLAGWSLHYAVGAAFVMAYGLALRLLSIPMSLLFYLIAGAFSGLIGIAVWGLTFRLHPNPPEIDFKAYYVQLFVAHILFALGVYTGAIAVL